MTHHRGLWGTGGCRACLRGSFKVARVHFKHSFEVEGYAISQKRDQILIESSRTLAQGGIEPQGMDWHHKLCGTQAKGFMLAIRLQCRILGSTFNGFIIQPKNAFDAASVRPVNFECGSACILFQLKGVNFHLLILLLLTVQYVGQLLYMIPSILS